MTTIKITNGQEIRRITLVGEEARGMASFSAFVNKVQQLFPALAGQVFSLVWYDEDADKITVSSDIEFQEAIRSMRDNSADGKGILRFEVVIKAEPERVPNTPPAAPAAGEAVHTHITCDECGMHPIRGLRYKCTVREDFDLCAACEARRVQPYPMVKIAQPDQAPAALFYAFREDGRQGGHCGGRGGRGGWGRRGHGHHGYRRFGAQLADTLGVPVSKEHEERAARCREHWQRKAEHLSRQMDETVVKPFVDAMDKMFSDSDTPKPATSSSTTSAPAASAEATNAQDQLEEQMMQEAIQESLLLNEVAQAFAQPPTPPRTSSESTPSAAATAAAAPPVVAVVAAPAPPPPLLVSGLSKPALRFVKDVTYPDGAAVYPGSVLNKVWKVRNDGAFPWPEGCVLVTAGGDVMCEEGLRVPLPTVAPAAETEIAVQLRAPDLSGMYTAYFRAQTKEGQSFGHRIWSTLQVQEAEENWTTVSTPEVQPVPAVASAVASVPAVAVASAASSVASAPSAPATVATSPVVSVASATVQPLHLMWRKELQVLADMGFTDPDVCVPVLQTHLVTPVSLSGDRTAAPNVDGMQRVVAALLSP